MASVNNVYFLAGEPFKKYVKTVPSTVAGYRLDPMIATDARPVGFVLESAADGFDPEREVLALYSAREDAYVRQTNRALFDSGLLKEYDGVEDAPAIDYANFMTDEEVRSVAAIKTPAAMRARIESVTAYFTLMRILRAAESLGAKKTVLDVLRAREAELQN